MQSLRTVNLPLASCHRSHHTLHVSKADVFRFGANTASSQPVFRDVEWTVKSNENWAVTSPISGHKTALFEMLLGHFRISPHPKEGLFPFITAQDKNPYESIAMVAFGNRRRASGGAFYDYSARYGAVRNEDRITLRQSMFPETLPSDIPPEIQDILGQPGLEPVDIPHNPLFEELSAKLGLQPFLDLPIIALSNGQTRRARILKAILLKPELLLLDEPLTGLDVQNRPTLLEVLHSLQNSDSGPRIIMGLRSQDPVPGWITHLALVKEDRLLTGEKSHILTELARANATNVSSPPVRHTTKSGQLVADLKNVNVKYGPREVLKGIDWQIFEGDRWHLKGSNGSGKTTLLSLVTGDHPQSYTQQANGHLNLFGKPRTRIPTPQLQSLIGIVSPELFDAFPRRPNTTVWDVVGTGFDATFIAQGQHNVGKGVLKELSAEDLQWRLGRMDNVLEGLSPKGSTFKTRLFVDLSAGEQRLVLLMRALVGRPGLVILDELWSGMDESTITAARSYLRNDVGDDQAVVVISHWDEEVPWGKEDGLKTYQLERGTGSSL
ncbi:P-loop containing nucleoside triphosphate hydrolase protein [Mycena floridula]|nr:P-loop containing nucleoside triphosphate hydrolase protein [Mycena floridula]